MAMAEMVVSDYPYTGVPMPVTMYKNRFIGYRAIGAKLKPRFQLPGNAERIKPTEEQQAMNSADKTLLVNARSGTGKTATLQMMAGKYRDKRIVYLVFNRRPMEEARHKFPPNVGVSTVHGLAFHKEGRNRISSFPT